MQRKKNPSGTSGAGDTMAEVFLTNDSADGVIFAGAK
jgi:hypothetical protein